MNDFQVNSSDVNSSIANSLATDNSLLLDIEHLSVTFGEGARAFRAVDDVSLKIKQGEVVAVVGESGSGKSVTMMALMGFITLFCHCRC